MKLATLRKSGWLVVLATLLCLLPFVNKAFHIDDTLFLWVARHIQNNPFDFYGFAANWYGTMMPMAEINQNPPLVSYYIALVTLLFGWQEWTLHLAFLLPAIGVTLGTYTLAKEFVNRPALAALVALATPVFLVSASNVMSDVMMVAFYIWAIIFWIRGLERNSLSWLITSVLLIAFAALTKYFGLTAIPLLLLYTVLQLKAFDRRLAVVILLALPVLLLLGYQQLTVAMYGRGLLSAAASYSIEMAGSDLSHLRDKGIVGLAFLGGCVPSAFFFAPLLWKRRTWIVGGGVLFAMVLCFLLLKGSLFDLVLQANGNIHWLFILQTTFFVVAGLHLLAIAFIELYQRRDPCSVLLCCWIVGTFAFAWLFNWTVNGRIILPLVPAGAILIARRLDLRATTEQGLAVWLPLIPAILLAMAVSWGDYTFANSQRQAAGAIIQELRPHGYKIWYQGHWGFQYYMEQAGAMAVDIKKPAMQPGDFLVLPNNNTNIYAPAKYISNQTITFINQYSFTSSSWITTMHPPPVCVGFYASVWGPLPYVFGYIPQEEYYFLFRRTK